MVALGGAPDMSTALALLLAKGADNVEEVGFPLQRQLARNQFTSYLARCERAVPEHLAEQVALLGAEVLRGGDRGDRPRGRGELGVAELGRQRVGDRDQALDQLGVPVAGPC